MGRERSASVSAVGRRENLMAVVAVVCGLEHWIEPLWVSLLRL